MRDISANARSAVQADSTGEVLLFLLTIEHPDLLEPIRVVNNTENITSNGHEYIGYPFEVTLPQDSAEQVPQVQLSIDNVGGIINTIRALMAPPTIRLQVVLASQPDVIEVDGLQMTMTALDYNAKSITGTIGYENILNEPFPVGSYLPSNFPGLFA